MRHVVVPGGLRHWVQTGVYFALFGVFALWLLLALSDLKEKAERQEVELTIRNIRTGIQLAAAEALISQRGASVSSWLGRNPVSWLGNEPRGYQGECSSQSALRMAGGGWCFDHENRELVYRPHNQAHLRQDAGGAKSCKDLRWRIARAGELQKDGGFVGVRLVAISGCQWLIPGD